MNLEKCVKSFLLLSLNLIYMYMWN